MLHCKDLPLVIKHFWKAGEMEHEATKLLLGCWSSFLRGDAAVEDVLLSACLVSEGSLVFFQPTWYKDRAQHETENGEERRTFRN